MGSETQSINRLRTERAKDVKGVAEVLRHAIRGELENFVNSSLIKELELGIILVKHYLGNMTENRDTSLIIPNHGGKSSGTILAQVIAPA